MRGLSVVLLAALSGSGAVSLKPGEITYALTVDTADVNVISVEMRMRAPADTFTLAAAAHPEYDDKYWRYLEDLRITRVDGQPATVVRVDSVRWQIRNAGGDVVLNYRIRLPQPSTPRAAWRAFLTPTGGLVGGPHSFLYVIGAESARAIVQLRIPDRWQVATALTPAGPRTYRARNIAELMDSPMFVGNVSVWQFDVNRVPHRVVYWRAPGAVAFDTAAFVNGIERIVHQTFTLFGSAPYSEYTFMFQDGAYGGLEHVNSVTLGAPSADLARNSQSHLQETAHEFFHTWNLMRIRPREYRDLDYRVQPLVSGLWFSEGLTIFYADLLARRAGLPVNDSTRIARLETLLARYYSSPGNARFSAEQVSRVAYNTPPGALGDYDASTHLQGEVIGTMLDLMIRSATDGARSIDDVMRLMYERFVGPKRFVSGDVEQAVTDVCRCDVRPFFDAHVRGGAPIDFDRYLGLIGLRTRVTSTVAMNSDGLPIPDLRVRAWQPAAEEQLSLLLWHPESVWMRAGLHTGDRVVSVDGSPIRTWPDFRTKLTTLHIGDTVRVTVQRPRGPFEARVVVTGYARPVVHVEEIGNATERQRALRAAWLQAR